MTDNNSNTGLARRNADNDIAAPQDSRHALQPRSMKEAFELAKAVAGTPFAPNMDAPGAFAAIVSGSELGLTAMQSLRAYTIVKGKPTLWADAMVAVVLASGKCESWETVETSAERCEVVTRRKGSKRDQRCVWTREDAERAKLLGNDTWKMYPAQMLRHRASSELARAVYPDVLLGVYSHEEMRDSAPLRSDPAAHAAPTDAAPQPLALPSDAGPSPSEASRAAKPDAAPAVAHYEIAERLIDGAATLDELKAAWAVVYREHLPHLGPHETLAITEAKGARKAALAAQPPAPKPDGDEPPPSGPTGGKRARKAPAPADATGDATAGTEGASAGPAAWLASEDATRAHAAEKHNVPALEASARLHGAALAKTAWGVRVYAERLAAIVDGDVAFCLRRVSGWAAGGPVAAKAQRRAA